MEGGLDNQLIPGQETEKEDFDPFNVAAKQCMQWIAERPDHPPIEIKDCDSPDSGKPHIDLIVYDIQDPF